MSDYTKLQNEVISNLETLRKSAGLSLEDVGSILGITKQGYRKIEKGESQIQLKHLNKLANHYNVGLMDLLFTDLSHKVSD